MSWRYKDFLKKIESLQQDLCPEDLTGVAKGITTLASGVVAVVTGVIFGPSFLLYRFAKYLFEEEKHLTEDSLWMYWAGQIILPACAKKGIICDLESLNPGNAEERNIYFCFNLPITSEAIGESVLREVRNRIGATYNFSIIDINHIYDLSFSKGQLKICRKEEAEPNA